MTTIAIGSIATALPSMNLGTFPLTVTQTKIFNSIVILSLTYLACNSFAFGLIIGVYNIIGISYLSSPKHIYEKITFTQKNTITSISIALAWKAKSNEVKIRIYLYLQVKISVNWVPTRNFWFVYSLSSSSNWSFLVCSLENFSLPSKSPSLFMKLHEIPEMTEHNSPNFKLNDISSFKRLLFYYSH